MANGFTYYYQVTAQPSGNDSCGAAGLAAESYFLHDDADRKDNCVGNEGEVRAMYTPRSINRADHVVLLVHGIRTQATWTEMVKRVLEDETKAKVLPIKYGFLDTFRFLFPFFTRKAAVARFIREYRDARLTDPESRISVIAHSFGTYVVAKALEQETDIVLDKLVLCGCIIPNGFRVAPFRAQLGPDPILNDCGTHDIWPVIAKSVTWGYGSTGTFGFGTNGIRDRFHKFTHSAYFDEAFVRQFWVPYLADGVIKGTDWEVRRPNPPYWQSLFSVLPLKWIFPLALVAYLVWPFRVPGLQVDRQIYVGHWMGVSQAYARLHIGNRSLFAKQIVIQRAVLTSPGGRQIPLFVERINNCNGMMPLSLVITVGPYGRTSCDVEFLADMSQLTRANQAVERIVRDNNVHTLLADPNRTLVTGQLLSDLTEAANTGLVWTEGKWGITVEYDAGAVSGSNQIRSRASGSFEVTQKEVAYFREASNWYRSGIGVFFFWRNMEPNRLLPVIVFGEGRE